MNEFQLIELHFCNTQQHLDSPVVKEMMGKPNLISDILDWKVDTYPEYVNEIPFPSYFGSNAPL